MRTFFIDYIYKKPKAMPVFHNVDGKLRQLDYLSLDKEKTLQNLVEKNLKEIFEMDFIASEFRTTHGGIIDTLAIDPNGAPVIIEYKRNRNDNVIIQALFYLNWLRSQKPEFFEMLVTKKVNSERAKNIDWKNPRVICIAENYSDYDLFALYEISANLELYRYSCYKDNIFTLENINENKSRSRKSTTSDMHGKQVQKIDLDVEQESGLEIFIAKASEPVKNLFFTLRGRIFEMDENIQERITNNYIGYKVSKMFAEVHIQKSKLMLYLRPIHYLDDTQGKIYKVPDSFNWVLNKRIYIESEDDLKYAMPLIEQSYKDVL